MNAVCVVDGCDRPVRARGMCRRHYDRVRFGDAGRPACTMDGCDRPSRSRGMCASHYQQWWVAGEGVQRQPGRGALVEDVEFLAGTDSPERIAARLGRKDWGSVAQSLRRAGRPDLIDRVIAYEMRGGLPTARLILSR